MLHKVLVWLSFFVAVILPGALILFVARWASMKWLPEKYLSYVTSAVLIALAFALYFLDIFFTT